MVRTRDHLRQMGHVWKLNQGDICDRWGALGKAPSKKIRKRGLLERGHLRKMMWSPTDGPACTRDHLRQMGRAWQEPRWGTFEFGVHHRGRGKKAVGKLEA